MMHQVNEEKKRLGFEDNAWKHSSALNFSVHIQCLAVSCKMDPMTSAEREQYIFSNNCLTSS